MPSDPWLGILSALASAAVWGSGDFSGGLAARRGSQYQVLALAAVSGAVMLAALVLAGGEAWPSAGAAAWAAAAGFSGALGIAALYRGLAVGRAAMVAPVAAVVSAALPVVFGALSEGVPSATRLAGFAVALTGIWLVSQTATASGDGARRGLVLGFAAGLGFGGFFILIALAPGDGVFGPLLVARLASLGTALLLMAARRVPLPGFGSNPVALLAGVLDAGGNIFYVLAQHLTRLDIAAVLSSLYPAATVLLAWALLKERVTAAQWGGAALCLAAVVLIAL
ncbi:MAG: DMT family transporter [Anaerolineales bacterium]|nr:DMT family transporter [Anaerolineales bacterium]